jgi:hypothetical protein
MNETENKEEKLELVFGTENLLESAKEPFIGEVIYADFPCNCEECKKGAATMMEKFQKEAPERLHIHIKPLTVYTEVQHNWWIPTKTKLSRWGALQEQLQTLGLMSRFKVEGFKAFRGMVAEWHWKEVEVGVTGDLKSHWLPMRILGQQETEELMKNLEVEQASTPHKQPAQPSDGVTSDAIGTEATGEGTDTTGADTKLD